VEASIGSTGRPTDLGQRVLAAGHGGDHDGHGAARQHRRAAYGAELDTRCGRDRLLDQCVKRALADVAGHHAPEPALLVGSHPGEEVAHPGRTQLLGSRAGHRGEPAECLVDLERGDRRLGGGVGKRAQAPPTDARAALQDRASEVRRDHGQLDDLGLRQPLGDRDDLGLPRPGGRDDPGGLHQVAQQHAVILPEPADGRGRDPIDTIRPQGRCSRHPGEWSNPSCVTGSPDVRGSLHTQPYSPTSVRTA
jgi:hypothetical protein